jgi:membrane protease YdiL (CAAX protease family)
MSILAVESQTSGLSELVLLCVLIVLSLAGIVAFVRARAYLPGRVLGPSRLGPTRELWPVAVGLVVLIFSVIVAAGLAAAASGATQEQLQDAADPVSMTVNAAAMLLGLVPPVVLLYYLARPSLMSLGVAVSAIPRGVKIGLIAATVGIPLTYVIGYAVEAIYSLVQYDHPPEHDLLRAIKEHGLAVRVIGVLSAVVVAPLAEEVIFRGLLQTLVREALTKLFGRQSAMPAAIPGAMPAAMSAPSPASADAPLSVVPMLIPPPPPDATPDELSASPSPAGQPPPLPLAYLPEAVQPSPPTPPRVATPLIAWTSIILTSAFFAVVHPLWTAPIIFCLSLVIGYVYERWGNLYAPIALHAAFNTLNVAFYVSAMQ